ncbi:solute carrier family 2, facilitated glucose transporter member 11 isoform X12 [Ovis canadensis]|uniref:solute carrier family 2, facilitated glucose transporter member 11 isoform X12 n=1 Tax=Ovis canadensis TaxID=37174 RepID=UPI003751FA60
MDGGRGRFPGSPSLPSQASPGLRSQMSGTCFTKAFEESAARKKSLLVNNAFVLAAAALFGFSRRAGSFEMIMLGRLLVGISAGVGMNVQPMYLGESAPKELRGAVAMTSAIFTAVGLVMGQVVGLRELLGGPQAWPLLLASCLVPGALQLASLPLLPESPRYLLIDCGDPAACRAALQRLRGPADLAGELAELEQERAACRGGRARRPWELFRERALRRQVASLVVLGGAMELCGNDAMYAYASAVFSQAGIPQDKTQYAAIGTGGCELLATLLSCLAIERAGRRVLLTGGYRLMTCWGSVFTAALCLQGSFSWTPYLAMACIFAFILSFGIGPAGVTGILATELFDQMARPAAYMVCGALMWTMLFLVGLVFPFLVRQELRGDLGGAAQTQLPREEPRPSVGRPRGRPVHGAVARPARRGPAPDPPPPVEPLGVQAWCSASERWFQGPLGALCLEAVGRKPTMTNSEKRRGGKHSL